MSVLDGAVAVLEKADRPLHYREITKRLLEENLWQTAGKTPEATVRGALGEDVRRRGAASRFQRTAKGTFALRAWNQPESVQKLQVEGEGVADPAGKRLSFNDATELVLERFGNRKPMHYRDIAEKALSFGLLNTSGKTPAATVYAQVIQVRYDPDAWLDLAEEAGMEYVCFTTKHHDGFCLWDTAQTEYNVMRSPCGKDVLGMLAQACRRRGFPLCLYYAVADWHHPNYPNQGRSHELPGPEAGDEPDLDRYLDFLRAQVRELCTAYGELGGFWPERSEGSQHIGGYFR